MLPGVGAFPAGDANLRALGLVERRARAPPRPLLGVCLGMQLLFERSEEIEPTDGLGLIPGAVTALRTAGLRVPHIGWNEVALRARLAADRRSPAGRLPLLPRPFARRFAPPTRETSSARTEYGERFASIVQRGATVFGVQFHPEKSSSHGLRMLRELRRPVPHARASGRAAAA